ncbi:MAG: tetratricopeptide repeat protein [Acidobacteriota bacterium]
MGAAGKIETVDAANTGHGLESLKQAVLLTRSGRYLEALEQFEENLPHWPATWASDAGRHRVLSHYGLCLSMVWGRTEQALALCQEAVDRCPPSADLYLNLALVQLRHRQRDAALETLRRGLAAAPRHMGLLTMAERLQTRRKPVFPFFKRKHPLNRLSGQLLAKVRRLWQPPPDLLAP